MMTEEETSIMNIQKALATHDMKLKQVNGKLGRKGGPAFNLMKEKECSLVVTVKLTDLKKENTWNHFIAWDGNVIYYYPDNCRVNRVSDRTEEGSKVILKRLSPEKKFLERDICAMFEFQCYPPSN